MTLFLLEEEVTLCKVSKSCIPFEIVSIFLFLSSLLSPHWIEWWILLFEPQIMFPFYMILPIYPCSFVLCHCCNLYQQYIMQKICSMKAMRYKTRVHAVLHCSLKWFNVGQYWYQNEIDIGAIFFLTKNISLPYHSH